MVRDVGPRDKNLIRLPCCETVDNTVDYFSAHYFSIIRNSDFEVALSGLFFLSQGAID